MILITRIQEDSLKTQRLLSEYKINSLIEPLIKLNFHSNMKINHNNETLLVTSMNAIRSLVKIDKNKDYKIIAIGESTANFARNNGFNNVISAGQNVKDLINYVLKNCTEQKFLYISGEKISYPLDNILSDYRINIKRIIVYDTIYRKKFSDKCYRSLQNYKIKGITFFSLNTAETFLKLIFEHKLESKLKTIKVYSLSRKITNFLSKEHWGKIYTADMPTHESLINSIVNN
ncbi:MAG: uroporphyrinogen-III synthase [Rickettsiaceae bacterium H1]|nr:uroporphyrinogen-III synthase [Rickettsiaceae bacterium H1]